MMSLRALCISRIARSFTNHLDTTINQISSQDNVSETDLPRIKSVVQPSNFGSSCGNTSRTLNIIDKYRLESLPEDLLVSVWNHVARISAQSGLIGGCVLSNRFESLSYNKRESSGEHIPLRVLNIAVKSLSRTTTSLDWNHLYMEDETLINLSSSLAASSLTTLNVESSLISDSSASCWSSFTSLSRVNVSNCCLITSETLREIVKLPNLIDLTFDETLASEIVPLLPSQIETVDIRYDSESENDINALLPVLQSRGTLENLLSLSFFDRRWALDKPDIFKDIRTRYPKLESLGVRLDFDALKDSISSFSGLRRLTLAFGPLRLSTEHMISLSRVCPELESLELDLYLIEPDTSLWSLSSLRSLVIMNSAVASSRIKAWPPLLNSLELRHAGFGHEEHEDFLSFLGQSCPDLKHFKITGTTRWTLDSVEVLQTFPDLETLILPPETAPPARGRSYSSGRSVHEQLRHYKGTLLPAASFPNLEVTDVCHPLSCVRTTIAKTPSLRHVKLNLTSYESKNQNHPIIEDASKFLSHCISLRSLTLRGALNPSQIIRFASLPYLSSLKLKSLFVSDEVLTTLLSGLRLLQHLEITTTNTSTLVHQTLLTLKLRVEACKIWIDSENLPALQTLIVGQSGKTTVDIEGLQQLRLIKFSQNFKFGFSTGATTLTLRNCPRLQLIDLSSTTIASESSITNCPSLKNFELPETAKHSSELQNLS